MKLDFPWTPSLLALTLIAAPACLVTQRDHDALVAKNTQLEKDLAKERDELAKTRADFEATRQRLDNALRASADSSSDLLSSKKRLNELAGRVDEVQHAVDEVRRDVGATRTELYARIDELKSAPVAPASSASTKGGGVAPAAPAPSIPADKAEHFSRVKDAYTKRDFATVRALGPEYVNRYSNDDRADEVLFMQGDADLQDSRPSSALGHFNRLLKLYSRSRFLDRTLFGMGEAYLMLHDCANANLAFDACEKRFSKDKIGADARAKLKTIAQNPPGLCAPS